MSLTILRISAGFLVATLILLALSLYLSSYYLDEQRRLAAAGDVEGAVEKAQTAARLDPFSSEPLQAQASLLQQQDRNQKAADVLENAIRRDPRNNTPYLLLASLQAGKLNDNEAAAQTYRKVLELNPKATLASTMLAQTLLRQGDLEGARRTYEDLREIDQISAQGLYDLGRIYVRTGEPEKGVETLRAAKRKAASDLESLPQEQREQRVDLIQSMELAIADALVVEGQYEEAMEIVAQSPSEQAPAILELLKSNPEEYRESVLNSAIY